MQLLGSSVPVVLRRRVRERQRWVRTRDPIAYPSIGRLRVADTVLDFQFQVVAASQKGRPSSPTSERPKARWTVPRWLAPSRCFRGQCLVTSLSSLLHYAAMSCRP